MGLYTKELSVPVCQGQLAVHTILDRQEQIIKIFPAHSEVTFSQVNINSKM